MLTYFHDPLSQESYGIFPLMDVKTLLFEGVTRMLRVLL
jgi:hypothetical protein